jgi:hypothetical protein
MSEGPGGRDDAAILREFLRDADVPCPLCAYNLRNLQSDRCPECGAELELRVGATNFRSGMLAACISPLMMLFGLTVLLGMLFARYGPPGRPRDRWAYLLLIAGAVAGLLAVALYRRRRWYLQLQPEHQIRIAVACWIITTITFGVAALLM